MGALDGATIDGVIQPNIKRIAYCLSREFKQNSDVTGGILMVKFQIAPDGSVAEAVPSPRDTTLDSEAVTDCAASQIRALQFPKPRGGGIVMVKYPIHFQVQR